MNVVRAIFIIFPIFIIFVPTIRIGSIPLRVEDIILIFLLSCVGFYNKGETNKIYSAKISFIFFALMILVVSSALFEWLFSTDTNFKTLFFGLSFIKYYLWFIVVTTLFSHLKVESKILGVIKFCFYIQLFVIFCQKFDLLGFGSGFFYNLVIKYYAIPNIYATTTDLEQLTSTHMNFSFRPAGIIGSSTVTGMCLLLLGLYIYNKTGNYIYRLLTILSLVLSFAKIAIVCFLILEIVIPLFRADLGKVKVAIFEMIFISPVALYAVMNLGVMDNLERTLDGSDRGVTHRGDVFELVFNQDLSGLLWGNYNSLPFSAFDSGILLTIYRHGAVYLLFEYVAIFLIFSSISRDRFYSFYFLIVFIFSDMTFGSVFNPVFSNLIVLFMLLSLYGFNLKRDIK
ncbi:hypothetical protein ACK3YD_11080 [Aeromonas caviae]